MIRTAHVNPPIPMRRFDWCAYDDDKENGPVGWGRTEEEARWDLVSQLEGNETP